METLKEINKRLTKLDQLIKPYRNQAWGYKTEPGYIQMSEYRHEIVHLIGLKQSGQFVR